MKQIRAQHKKTCKGSSLLSCRKIKDNTNTNPALFPGHPVYRTDGFRIADNNAGIWQASLNINTDLSVSITPVSASVQPDEHFTLTVAYKNNGNWFESLWFWIMYI